MPWKIDFSFYDNTGKKSIQKIEKYKNVIKTYLCFENGEKKKKW